MREGIDCEKSEKLDGLYEVGLVGEVRDVWFVRGRFGWGG